MQNRNIYLDSLFSFSETQPGKTAFLEAETGFGLTYSELASAVLRAAGAIMSAAGGPGGDLPVAVLTDRSPLAVAAFLGAAAAGRWYAAIDAELPPERLKLMTALCRPAALINASSLPDGGFSDICEENGCPYIPREVWTSAAEASRRDLPGRPADSPMFGIFTSGSTGTPKLVVKSRAAMESFTGVYDSTFGFSEEEIFGNQIPFYFDASTKDIYSTVRLGASCVILPAKAFAFPVKLVDMLNEHRISTAVWVPSALVSAAKFDVFSVSKPEFLKKVLFVGEKMPVKYLNVWRRALPDAEFVNLYGSTEVAGNSCYFRVSGDFDDSDILPVGRPFPGTRVFLLKKEGEAYAESDEGEICVAGPGLAEGYFGDPEKTASVFREITVGDFSGRVYFSGDTGRYDAAGELVCVSRKDSQIKHMGHRIELGEIEAAAVSCEGVGEAACFYDPEKERIVLFFSAPSDISRELRRALAAKLPKYMIPSKFVWRAGLPHNRNGKLDRAAMRAGMTSL